MNPAYPPCYRGALNFPFTRVQGLPWLQGRCQAEKEREALSPLSRVSIRPLAGCNVFEAFAIAKRERSKLPPPPSFFAPRFIYCTHTPTRSITTNFPERKREILVSDHRSFIGSIHSMKNQKVSQASQQFYSATRRTSCYRNALLA